MYLGQHVIETDKACLVKWIQKKHNSCQNRTWCNPPKNLSRFFGAYANEQRQQEAKK